MSQSNKFCAIVIENLPELSSDVMQGWIENPKAVAKILADFAPPVAKEAEQVVPKPRPLLESLGTITTSAASLVKIDVSQQVRDWWPEGTGNPTTGVVLHCSELLKRSVNSSIIAAVGGVGPAVVAWGEFLGSLHFPDGKKSGIRRLYFVPQKVKKLEGKRFSYFDASGNEQFEEVDDSKYLFDVDGQWFVLRAVDASWGDFDWVVCAGSVEDPSGWEDGCQVFSRNPALGHCAGLKLI